MQSTRQTIRCDLLLPIASNDGIPFPPALFEQFEHFLVDLTGGFTHRGEVVGAWRSPDSGEILADRSRSYSIVLDTAHAPELVAEIDTYIKRAFHQHAAYVELFATRATAF